MFSLLTDTTAWIQHTAEGLASFSLPKSPVSTTTADSPVSVMKGCRVALPNNVLLHRYFEEQLAAHKDQGSSVCSHCLSAHRENANESRKDAQHKINLCNERRNSFKLNKYQAISGSVMAEMQQSGDVSDETGRTCIVNLNVECKLQCKLKVYLNANLNVYLNADLNVYLNADLNVGCNVELNVDIRL